MKCPFCLETFQGKNVLGRHIFGHSKVEISLKLAEFVSKQEEEESFTEDETKIILGEPSIPVSKIEARIKELEEWTETPSITMKLRELKDLLPPQAKANKEKEKPDQQE
jgi:hypothetical protein